MPDQLNDDDKKKMVDYINQQQTDQTNRQNKSDALNKMIAQPNPQLDGMMNGMAMGAIGPVKAAGEVAGGEILGAAQKYTPEALAEAKQGVNDLMTAGKPYFDPAVKSAQARFNNILGALQRYGK